MKSILRSAFIPLFALLLLATSCGRSGNDVVEDTRTAGRYMGRGVRSLFGKHGESRAAQRQSDFASQSNQDFIPLQDDEMYGQLAMGDMSNLNADSAVPQSKESPGEPGSFLPGAEGFTDPSTDSALANIFKNVKFPYNSNLIKGQENLNRVKAIANYLKRNPNTYIFVEGHCDERGTAAYNLALGARRSNAVRNFLIREGVELDRVFTISYGHERPLVRGNTETSWAENRRAQFRTHTRGQG